MMFSPAVTMENETWEKKQKKEGKQCRAVARGSEGYYHRTLYIYQTHCRTHVY